MKKWEARRDKFKRKEEERVGMTMERKNKRDTRERREWDRRTKGLKERKK
jgi:hypothetical protein